MSILHNAVREGNLDTITNLLNSDAIKYIDQREFSSRLAGFTPLLLALLNGHTDIADLLISKGAIVNILSTQYETSDASDQHTWNEQRHIALKTFLALKKLPTPIREHDCRKALYSSKGENVCTKILDQYLHARNEFNVENKLVTVAEPVKSRAKSLSQRLSLRFKKSEKTEKVDLHQLIEKKDIAGAKELINTTPCNINETNDKGWTPLHLAAHLGLNEVAEALIKAGADVDLAMSDGRTPLYLATYSGYCEQRFNPLSLLEILLKAGANANRGMLRDKPSAPYFPSYYWVTGTEITPLFLVAKENKHEAVKLLLLYGAHSFFSTDNQINLSCIDNQEIRALVEEYAANPMAFHEKYNEDSIYELHRMFAKAISEDNIKYIQTILTNKEKYFVRIDDKFANGFTPIEFAQQSEKKLIVDKLKAAGAKVLEKVITTSTVTTLSIYPAIQPAPVSFAPASSDFERLPIRNTTTTTTNVRLSTHAALPPIQPERRPTHERMPTLAPKKTSAVTTNSSQNPGDKPHPSHSTHVTPYEPFPIAKNPDDMNSSSTSSVSTNPFSDDANDDMSFADNITNTQIPSIESALPKLMGQQYLIFSPNNNNNSFPLYEAARDGNIDSILSLIHESNVDVNQRTSKGDTAMHAAVLNNQLVAIKTLFASGADINIQTIGSGKTPLMMAATFPTTHPETLQLLIELGANIALTMHDGSTPLKMASTSGQREKVKILRDAGATIAAPRSSMNPNRG
jgi:ankyrin repeat protein